MQEPTKTLLTEKSVIKAKIKEDISEYKRHYFKLTDVDDLDFIKEMQSEFEELLHDDETSTVTADDSFKDLVGKYSKAGVLLRGLRVKEGLNQTEFAKLINTTQANLSSMENGSRLIGKNKAKLIAEKFGVDYRYFL